MAKNGRWRGHWCVSSLSKALPTSPSARSAGSMLRLGVRTALGRPLRASRRCGRACHGHVLPFHSGLGVCRATVGDRSRRRASDRGATDISSTHHGAVWVCDRAGISGRSSSVDEVPGFRADVPGHLPCVDRRRLQGNGSSIFGVLFGAPLPSSSIPGAAGSIAWHKFGEARE